MHIILCSLCIADASSFIERERIVPSQLLPILFPLVQHHNISSCYSSHFPVKKTGVPNRAGRADERELYRTFQMR